MMPDGRALWLSLLAHGLAVVYVAGGAVILVLLLRVLIGDASEATILIFPLIASLVICRRGERFIAETCIRHHLNEHAKVGPARIAGPK